MTDMKKLCGWYLFLQLYTFVLTQKTVLETPEILQIYRNFRDFVYDVIGKTGDLDGSLYKQAVALNKTQKRFPPNAPFFCNVTGGRSADVPTSVHRLRPGDIDVIAAMGDSLTAGAGLLGSNLLHILVENRGTSMLGGGQASWREFLTLPNILKEFNPNLIGYSTGDATNAHNISQLNVAFSGSMSADMPFMAETLVERIKNDSRIDVKKHWKLISLMIGDNDFCTDICYRASPSSILDDHKADMIEVLRTLRDNLPRTVFVLVPPINVAVFADSFNNTVPSQCFVTTEFECSCFFGILRASHISEYSDVIKRWQDLEEEICNYLEFQTDDFAAVFLPSIKGLRSFHTDDGGPDLSYVAPDCFHPSQKAEAFFAVNLWNNLMEPPDKKSAELLRSTERFLCPSPENPYLGA